MNETTHPQSDPKIAAVQRIYEAFGRGDVEAVVAEVADDVDWVSVTATGSATVPWYGSYQGRAEVPRFFKEIGSNVHVTEFSPLSFTSSETDVMVALVWGITVHATGKSITLPMQHWFRFANGKIAVVRTAEDSEQTAAAFS
jgi:uncharacterized protein